MLSPFFCNLLPTDTVTGADAERLNHAQVVLSKFRIAEEALGAELFGPREVFGAVISSVLPNSHDTLRKSSIS